MCCYRLGLAAAALSLLAIAGDPAQAQPVRPIGVAALSSSPVVQVGNRAAGQGAHFRRVQTVYCYPRNHWWFYRPYTTAQEDFPRCMPYFHYPDAVYGRRGGRTNEYFK
ncbi:MAG: hypothetical protein ACREDO_05680 [Methyloceanibacter sp.]